jgi:hypothetical protein
MDAAAQMEGGRRELPRIHLPRAPNHQGESAACLRPWLDPVQTTLVKPGLAGDRGRHQDVGHRNGILRMQQRLGGVLGP